MDIIPHNKSKDNGLENLLKNFFIYFYQHGNGTEWMDYNLPPPSVLKHVKSGIFIGWALNGYFGTNQGQTYLNDIIARYLITFKDDKAQRLSYKPQKDLLDGKTHLNHTKYKLKEFQGLKSILGTSKIVSQQRNSDSKQDNVFYAIKFFCEDLILSQGIPTYSQLLKFAQLNFEYKEASTLRAKCRSIFTWYEARDFEIENRKKYENINQYWKSTKMTRIENCKQQNETKIKEARAKVLGAITELKHLNKKITGNAIARITGQNVKTARKYLKEFRAK